MSPTETQKRIDAMCREAMEAGGPGNATAIMCNEADEPAIFDDDKFDYCRDCGVRVRFRPYMPDLPKVCVRCVQEEMG